MYGRDRFKYSKRRIIIPGRWINILNRTCFFNLLYIQNGGGYALNLDFGLINIIVIMNKIENSDNSYL